MLGLRLDEALPLALLEGKLDAAALARLERLGLAQTVASIGAERGETEPRLTLTAKGRLLGDAVTADLLA